MASDARFPTTPPAFANMLAAWERIAANPGRRSSTRRHAARWIHEPYVRPGRAAEASRSRRILDRCPDVDC